MKKKIAVFTTGWCAEILSQFLKGMMNTLGKSQADIFLFLCFPTPLDTPAKQQGEMLIFDLPNLRDFDLAIIFGSGLDYHERMESILNRCKEAGVPVIIQGARSEGMSCVLSDNIHAMKEMCAHLLNEHNVKTMAYLAGTRDSYDSEQRLAAIREYLTENGREEALIDVFYTDWENAVVKDHIKDLCSSGKALPDAFICANDGIAMQACATLIECGYDIPGDVLVTGYDFLDDSQVFDPELASVDQCFGEMGEAATKLWNEIQAGNDSAQNIIIHSKFIPGESCGCLHFRNSDKVRRQMGREAFFKRGMTTYFNRKLDVIDATVLASPTFEDFKKNMHELLLDDHDYEGDSFHVILDPLFSLSLYDTTVKLNTDFYSKFMEVLYSCEDGVLYDQERFESRKLIPGYTGEGENHLYVFLPLHEADASYGYLAFRDCVDKVANRFLYTYTNRMALVFEKFRYTLTIDLINNRLLNMMRRDPLTKVNNRVAYEDKQKYLHSQIVADPNIEFGIAMFDVNNLKLINDSKGHEAGDEYLLRACHLICSVFKHSPVFRIGGDEFVAVLSGEDYENRDALMVKINDLMSPYQSTMPLPPEYVSIACGIASFNSETDTSAADVAKRADEAMYKDKTAKKSGALK